MTKIFLKWSKWLSISFFTLILTLLLALVFVLFTNPGLSLVLFGAEKALPQLQVGSHSGAIFPRFNLQNVRFKDESLHIDATANSITLAVTPACLTEPSVCIEDIAVDGLKFSMPEIDSSTEETGNESSDAPITAPLPLKIERISLSNIDLDILGNQIRWGSFSTALSFSGNRLTVGETRLDKAYLQLSESKDEPAKTTTSSAKPFSYQGFTLPDVKLPLQVDVTRLDINDFTLQQETPLIVHHLGLEGFAGGSKVEIKTLDLDMPQIKAELQGDVQLENGYPLTLDLNAEVMDPIAKGQTIELNAKGSVADIALNAKLAGLAKANLTLKAQPLTADLPFELNLTKGAVQWPLTGKSDYKVRIAQLNGKGSLKRYLLNLDTKVSGSEIPNLALTTKAQGSLSHIELSDFVLETLGGDVAGDAMVNWQAPINWSADVNLRDIQPGLQWPDAEGKLSGELETSGSLTKQGGWKIDLPILDVNGELRGYPLHVEGALKASDSKGKGDIKLSTSGVTLAHGPNKVSANGQLNKEWNMSLALNFPDLAKTIPELKGRVQGHVDLTGKMKQPDIKLALGIDELNWQQTASIQRAVLDGNISPLPLPKGNLNLKVTNAKYQQDVIDEATLKFSGTQEVHRLTVDVLSNIVSTSLLLTGALQDKPSLNWQGTLHRMSISSEQGKWVLNQATKLGFDLATEQASIAAHCWLQKDASICLDNNIQVGKSGEAAVTVKDFDFSQVEAFIPKQTEIKGKVDATAWAKWAPDVPPQVKASIRLPKGEVVQHLSQPVSLGWQSVTLNAELANNALKSDWNLDVTDNGDVTGNLYIPNVLVEDKQLDGELKLSTFSLKFLSPLVGEYSQLGAEVTTDLKLSGPIMQPQAKGQFVVDKMQLKGEISPIDIDSGRLVIDFNGYQAALNAAIQTPDGELKVTGDADWQDMSAWSSKVRIFAKQLMVDMPPMVKVKVEPDMTINLAPHQARIDGNIDLPWGRIVVEDLPPSAVEVSKDQVLLNASLQPIESSDPVPFDIATNIKIKIGDNFKLSAFGLEGELVGNLKVAQKDKGPFVTGEVNIVNGSYGSFGQDLLIKEGKILMNGPVDQPYVQITAIRNPDNTQDDVTAGIKVTGPADAPKITIFSEPSMPQANALSYLLRGQDIDGEAGGNAMTTTLIGLSLAKSGRLVGEIGEAFGVQDLQLDTAGSGDDSQVTVSGYVLPGLQVKYGVGIFDSVGEFTVRYRLLKDLYVEAVSGLDSAVDLLYQFEFN